MLFFSNNCFNFANINRQGINTPKITCVMENENLKDRIKEIMDNKHMNNKVFATETGINEGTLSLLLRGKTQPTLKHYEAIHTLFPEIAMDWLVDVKGPMYQN